MYRASARPQTTKAAGRRAWRQITAVIRTDNSETGNAQATAISSRSVQGNLTWRISVLFSNWVPRKAGTSSA